MKVYIVTSGVYSGYRICAVFPTRALAKAYVDEEDTINGSDARVETHELLDEVPKPIVVYIIERDRTGDLTGGTLRPGVPEREWGPIIHRTQLMWPDDFRAYGPRRAEYRDYGHRQFARAASEADAERTWREAHAVEEAEAAGL